MQTKRFLSSIFSGLTIFTCFLMLYLTMRTLVGSSFFRPHDFTHAARLAEMRRSLQAGEFPVRWSQNFGFGYGMPLFNFYAPLPYYLGQIPMLIGADEVVTIKFLYLLNGLLAFFGMYLVTAKLWGKWGGLVGGVVFSLSTYRAVDLFVRGALGEAFAMVLVPFVIYGILVTSQKKERNQGVLITAFSLAGVLLSHNLMGLVSLGLVLAIGIGMRNLGVIYALVLAVGLGSFYILPSYFQKNLTRIDGTITVGYFDYHQHFLCAKQLFYGAWGFGGSLPGCSDDLSFAFGAFTIILFALGIFSIVWQRNNRLKRIGITCFLAALLFSFLTIGRSVWIWDQISLLRYFQFPWRLLTFAHVFLAIVAAGSTLILKKNKIWGWLITGLLLGVVVTQLTFYRPQNQIASQNLSEFYNTSPLWIRSQTSKTLNDYLPPQVKDESLPTPIDSRLEVKLGELVIVEDKPARVKAQVKCRESCRVSVNIFQFPGWQAVVDGTIKPLQKTSVGLPIYFLELDAGDHEITVQRMQEGVERLANAVSSATLGIILVYLFFSNRKRH